MIPTVSQVYATVRLRLGDVEVPGGQVARDSYLLTTTYLQSAFSDLLRAFDLHSLPRVERRSFYNLPANTSYLAPATAGVSNFGEPAAIDALSERSVRNSSTITGVTLGAGYVDLTTSAPHSFTAGQSVVVFGPLVGMSDDIHDQWTISVPGASTVRLNGCVAVGTWTSGGTISDSSEDFTSLGDARDFIDSFPATPGANLGRYSWLGGAFRFSPSSTPRQLRLSYLISGAPQNSLTASMGIDDSLNYLATKIAALLAADQGFAASKVAYLNTQAVGNPLGLIANCDGGHLGDLVRSQIRQMQSMRIQSPRYRPKRNVGPYSGYGGMYA